MSGERDNGARKWRLKRTAQCVKSAAEVRELTGLSRYSAQARALTAMQIPYWRRPDGTLAVLREEITHAAPTVQHWTPQVRPVSPRRVLPHQQFADHCQLRKQGDSDYHPSVPAIRQNRY